jgi:glucosamine kinase
MHQPAAALCLTGVQEGAREARTALALFNEVALSCGLALSQAARFFVGNDGLSALYGAHLGEPGAIIVAGTGSIGLGMAADGRITRVGGWGWLVGDEGSAAWIGLMAARRAYHALDGLAPPTALCDVLLAYFTTHFPAHFDVDAPEESNSLRHVKRILYDAGFGAKGFAVLAPLVGEVAQSGDPAAQAIIRDAGDALGAMALQLGRDKDIGVVAPVGGAFAHVAGLRAAFEAHIARSGLGLRVTEPALPPVCGALIVAAAQAGLPRGAFVNGLDASWAAYAAR